MEGTRPCPFCAETIQTAAVICRFCKSDLRPGGVTAPAPKRLQDDAGLRLVLPVGRSGWAIAAGYLGLFSLLIIPAPIALLVSIVATVHLRRHPDLYGWGRTIFGLITSGLMTLLFLLGILSFAFHKA